MRKIVVFVGLCLTMSACEVGDGDFDFDGSIFDDAGGRADGGIGDDDSGVDGDAAVADAAVADAGEAISPEAVPQHLAQAICGGYEACLGAARTRAHFRNQDCEDIWTKQQMDRDFYWLSDAIDLDRVVFRPAALAQCKADLQALACDVHRRRMPASCENAIEGQVTIGGNCNIDQECLGNAYCEKGDPESCPGTCVPPIALGGSCANSGECEDGLVCEGALDPTCVQQAVIGEECETKSCKLGLECVDESGSLVCRDVYAGQAGDACDAKGALCQTGLICASQDASTTAGTCVPPYERDGACKRAVPSGCPSDQYCDAAPAELGQCLDLEPGVCVNKLCLPGSICQGDQCVAPMAQEPCTDSGECAPDHLCLANTCRALVTVGEDCDTARVCYSGMCESGKCVTPLLCSL